MRVLVTLECTECGHRNYQTEKNKTKTTDRLQFKKYCPNCKKHTLHKETR
ncbi:MAG TPA: 50S ribosomal protein L33 [Coprothermobacter sp.]|nr:50S ribosomal protein L33 [Coprothermobacter sp.]